MALQRKKFKNNNNIFTKFITPGQRVEEIIEGTDYKSVFLPQGVDIEDIDTAVFELFKNNNDFTIVLPDEVDGRETVPAFFMNNQRWAEFSKTWTILDQDKNVSMPFITVRRIPEIKKGTYMGEKYTIPNRRTFSYVNVPFFENGLYGYDIYKVPQPIAVDISYEIKMFSTMISDINIFMELFLKNFSSLQYYCKVKAQDMRITCEESFGDSGTMVNINGDRFYVSEQTITIMGRLIDEKEFKIIRSFNRITTNVNTPDGTIDSVTT
jgi:hypothetical protein